jgi:hypothetical protein
MNQTDTIAAIRNSAWRPPVKNGVVILPRWTRQECRDAATARRVFEREAATGRHLVVMVVGRRPVAVALPRAGQSLADYLVGEAHRRGQYERPHPMALRAMGRLVYSSNDDGSGYSYSPTEEWEFHDGSRAVAEYSTMYTSSEGE